MLIRGVIRASGGSWRMRRLRGSGGRGFCWVGLFFGGSRVGASVRSLPRGIGVRSGRGGMGWAGTEAGCLVRFL